MKPEQLKYSILKKAFSGQLVMVDPDSEKPKVKAVELEETPFDIPDDWFWSNLGNCCEMYTGNSISETVKKAKYAGLKEGYDYIATKDVTFERTIEYDNGVRIPVDDDFRIAYNGSVLMCIEGGSAGRKIGILDRDVCFGNKLCTFNSKEIVNRYIYYYLQSHEFKAFFMDNMSGIIGGVSIKKLKELPIPVPTVSEQKAIVTKIEELLPYVDRYAEAYEKLEQFNAKFPENMKKSILQYAIQGKLVEQRPEEGTAEELYQQIQDERKKYNIKELVVNEIDEVPFDIPETWKWVHLQDIVKKTIKRGKSPKYSEKSNIQVFAQKCNAKTGGINMGLALFLDETTIDKYPNEEYMLDGDIVINSTGGGTMGRVGIFSAKDRIDDMGIVPDGHVTVVRACEGIDHKYLYYCLKHNQRYLETQGEGSTNQTELKPATIAELLIPLPPLKEQHRIIVKVEELLSCCKQLIT